MGNLLKFYHILKNSEFKKNHVINLLAKVIKIVQKCLTAKFADPVSLQIKIAQIVLQNFNINYGASVNMV